MKISLKGAKEGSKNKQGLKKVKVKTVSVFESGAEEHAKVEIVDVDDIGNKGKEELVIKPPRTREASRDSPEIKRRKLEYGINVSQKGGRENSRDRTPIKSKQPLDVSETTQESYKKVPVEEFGLAMLRGMGWKGDLESKKEPQSKSRPLLLGLGAKPSPVQLEPSYRVRSAEYSPVVRVEEPSDKPAAK